MRILDIIGEAVALIDTETPFEYFFGSDNSDANIDADKVQDKLAFVLAPPFSLSKTSNGRLTENYRCTILLAGKTDFQERSYTHKEVWGQMVDASKKLFMLLDQNSQVKSIVASENSMQADQFDANFDGVTMVVNITLNDNLTYC